MGDRQMVQAAPWPHELEDLVGRARYPGWSFGIDPGPHDDGLVEGPRLAITVRHFDTYHPERKRTTRFVYPIPAVTFGRASWEDWIFERCLDVWRHEVGESLSFAYRRPDAEGNEVEVSERPFAPFHGPGRDPNRNTRTGVDPMEVRVTQAGGRYPGWWWDGHTVHDDTTHDRDCRGQSYGPPKCVPVQLVDNGSHDG